jgi:hypothetical protein
VVQTPFGDSGHTTFFIKNKADYDKYAKEIEAEKECKVMKRINCRGAAMEACVTRHGTIVAPLMTELVGFKELTPYKGGWCGNEIFADTFTPAIRAKARKYATALRRPVAQRGLQGLLRVGLPDRQGQRRHLPRRVEPARSRARAASPTTPSSR